MNTDIDRDRGILTPADRAYLLGEAEMSHEQSKRNAEARIRDRIREGIVDFDLLVHSLDRRDRRQVFERATDEETFLDGITAMLSFAYIGLKEQGVDFERALVPAIEGAERAYGIDQQSANVTVDVEFDVETTVEARLDGIAERLDDGDPVAPRELFSLVMEGERALDDYERISLRLDDEDDRAHVDRLAEYLDAEVRYRNDALAVLRLDAA
ncbi:hypothetical protein SAMN06269185_1203 [Natronoarchaeum philippinense]|uniref:Domain of unknown function domain-containing protein n=1 Tax=Natronoarchaeum philippinense TaxID=558529 RepID=A0A285NAN6_NATPI|nr:hypothetical protein [Natronoarchaeum philippinense]SNZ06535.1 hypothetical protein SAMN06269185_1203 [Natronoarchaeum philippinense]